MSAKRIRAAGSILFWILLISVGGVSFLAAQVPKSEKEIPIFPGAVRDTDKESAMKSEQAGEMNPNMRSGALKLYVTSASAEDVFKFYLQKITAKEGVPDIDPRGLQRGTVSQATYEIFYYTDEDFADYEGHPGTWIKQSLVKNRKPYASGKCIKGGYINWYKKAMMISQRSTSTSMMRVLVIHRGITRLPQAFASA